MNKKADVHYCGATARDIPVLTGSEQTLTPYWKLSRGSLKKDGSTPSLISMLQKSFAVPRQRPLHSVKFRNFHSFMKVCLGEIQYTTFLAVFTVQGAIPKHFVQMCIF